MRDIPALTLDERLAYLRRHGRDFFVQSGKVYLRKSNGDATYYADDLRQACVEYYMFCEIYREG